MADTHRNYTVKAITIRNDILTQVDKERGTLNRSAYINEVLNRHLDRKEDLIKGGAI